MEFFRAKEDFEKAISLNPNNPAYYAKKALCHFTMKEYHKAIEDY